MRPDQERVRNLLIDTVTLLCKNSVQFKDELHVEGLLGVSVDKKDVFFVHISKEFSNNPSEGASVTQDTTDSQDDESRLADGSVDGHDGHNQSNNKAQTEQARIKTEAIEPEDECLIVEEPNIKLEGLVSPAEMVAGQRRALKRTSHGGLVSGVSSDSADQFHQDDQAIGVYSTGDPHLDNSQFGHTGEPPAKRKAEPGDDGYSLTQGDEDPGGSPWPSIANVPGFNPNQQSFQQDSDNSQMSMTDGTQPGCSTWSTPGRGPTDSVHPEHVNSFAQLSRVGSGILDGVMNTPATAPKGHECTTCGSMFTRVGNLRAHMVTHTGVRPHVCYICGMSFRRNTHLNRHSVTRHGIPVGRLRKRKTLNQAEHYPIESEIQENWQPNVFDIPSNETEVPSNETEVPSNEIGVLIENCWSMSVKTEKVDDEDP